MNRRQRRLYAGLAAPAAIATLAMLSTTPGATAATGTPTFTNFQPAGLNAFGLNEGGGSVGTKCPGSSACYNTAAEPAIRADNAGNFYASSENGLGGGTEAWRSTDGGLHYVTLASPDAGSSANTSGLSPGGGDTDLAVGPDPLSAGVYNLYVASLSLANIDVSNSKDRGNNFSLNPVAARVPGDDREWLAADDSHNSTINGVSVPVDGGQKVCVSYHDVASGDIHVDCSYDAGTTFPQTSTAFDAGHLYLAQDNMIGNLTIARDVAENDPTKGNHNIYQVFSGGADVTEAAACATSINACSYHTVWIAVSKDGGNTFTDHMVYNNPNTSVSYGHQFVNVTTDRDGNIYVVYTDNHTVHYSYSQDQGSTWKGPFLISKTPASTAIEPWSVAGGAGKLDVVYYGSSTTGDPETFANSASWHVYFAQNLNVFGNPTGFTQIAATPINHYGAVCEGGVSCTGNRDLYDDFGVAASPTTGRASIVYSDDQFGGTSSPHNPSCGATTTNTGSCDHTMFATQTSGSGIYP